MVGDDHPAIACAGVFPHGSIGGTEPQGLVSLVWACISIFIRFDWFMLVSCSFPCENGVFRGQPLYSLVSRRIQGKKFTLTTATKHFRIWSDFRQIKTISGGRRSKKPPAPRWKNNQPHEDKIVHQHKGGVPSAPDDTGEYRHLIGGSHHRDAQDGDEQEASPGYPP